MRAVIQRCGPARVEVEGEIVGSIDRGLVVLLGVGGEDQESDVDWLAAKIVNLRIFNDQADKMNLSLADIGGEMLIISQFTLWGDCRKGRRPGFSSAAPPDVARSLYEKFIAKVQSLNIRTAQGVFQAEMQVHLLNDGPVTLMLDSKKNF